ncbi:MAG: right-handed parallel beta-helix repeat-containing protein [Planctomycetes bacterium]|nr:right-handed parallel beta-helix repeat-containing protein [Planctomycetota bacterium]
MAAVLFAAVAHAQSQIHVDPTGSDLTGDGSAGNPYKTISFAAMQASSGDTLLLSAGTFGDDEQIVLGTKNLTIVGAGQGATVVRPHPTLLNSILRGFPPTTPENHRVVFLVDGAARVDIRSLTIDGAFRMPPTGRLHGIYYREGADGTLQDVEIVNCRANPLTGAQGPVAAMIYGTSATDPCEVTLRECLVHEWGKNGITALYNSVLTLEHSTVVGSGPVGLGLPAQNCVQVSYDARGVIRFNRITNSRYTVNTYTATGILLYNAAANTVVEGNSIAQCESGCYAIQDPAATRALSFQGNNVAGAASGTMLIVGNGGAIVANNTLHALLSTDNLQYDDTAGNVWSSNNYSDYGGSGTYTVDGVGNVDATPRGTCDELAAAASVGLGGVPVELIALELDGATGIDFVAVNEGLAPSLAVGLNTAGTYGVTNVAFGNANGRPVAIAAGEFDGNAGTDVAVLTVNRPGITTENKVYVFGNTAGALALIHTESLPAAVVSPTDLAAGDLDGSGGADLVIADLGGFVTPGAAHVLTNGGGGTSFTFATLPGTFTTQVQGVAVADLDGDLDLDVAATEGDGAIGRVLLWANDGLGGLTAHAASPVAVAVNPNAILAHDLDADGDLDLIVASIGAAAPVDEGTVTILRNELPAGFAAQTLRTDRGPAALAAGDLAADADPDTVRLDVAVLNLAGGTVGLHLAFDGVAFATGSTCGLGLTPRSIALGDVDGDGLLDLLVADAAASAVLVYDGVATARADLYGLGCPGTADRIPQIRAVGAPAVPNQPNATFGIALDDARPFAVAVLNASFLPGASLGPCTLLLGSIDVTWLTVTDVFGESGVIVPIPAAPPSLNGISLYFQWAVLDPQGDFLSLAAFSPGLKIRVGV